jgi:hypothetical protein
MITFSNKIISFKEQLQLLMWVFKNKGNFIPNTQDPRRKWISLDQMECPNLFWEIKERIILNEKVSDYKEEFNIGNIITWGINNTSINSHRDDSIDNHNHIRYNLCILKPFDGGDCVYDNKKISLMERHYIKCNATKFHSTTSVIGIKPRIMVSYGILTKK